MAEQVLHPEEIQDAPLPGQEAPSFGSTTPTATGVTQPTKIPNNVVPAKKIAVELLSTSLNTRSKKVLQTFDLVEQGAFRVGKYENGVSGEVAITSRGITAKNTAGNNTFALDGETGDAVFAGTIQGGTLIGGAVAVGDGSILIDGETKRMIWYNNGIPAIVIGEV